MEKLFKVAKFIEKPGDGDSGIGSFQKIGYETYKITFLMGTKIHRLRIVVDGYLTKQSINLLSGNEGYREKILMAISEYIKNGSNSKNRVTKKVTFEYLENFYSKKIINNIKTYLLPIKKEESRDNITRYGLITNNHNSNTEIDT
jgi:hypothetical protein